MVEITPASADDFIAKIEHPIRKADALVLDELFRKITGFAPKMWWVNQVGYGAYHYIYDSGREGDCMATGFSPRKSALTIYIMPGYTDFNGILSRLGKHKVGKCCLYINKLADVDLAVLEELIRAGLKDLDAKWPISAT